MDELARDLALNIVVLDGIIFEGFSFERMKKDPSLFQGLKIEEKIALLPLNVLGPWARYSPAERNKYGRDLYLVNGALSQALGFGGASLTHLDGTEYSIGEMLISIAAHEVRHRVQARKSVKLFSRDSKSTDGLLPSIIKAATEDFYLFGTRIVEEKGDEEAEFDALVIEKLVGEISLENCFDLAEIAKKVMVED